MEQLELLNNENWDVNDFTKLSGLPAEFASLTLDQLVFRHGGFKGMKNYVDILDKQMSALKKSIEIRRVRSELVERELVQHHVFSYLDNLSERLFDLASDDQSMTNTYRKLLNGAKKKIKIELDKTKKIREREIS